MNVTRNVFRAVKKIYVRPIVKYWSSVCVESYVGVRP